jgi:hypothetical protein
MGYNIMDKRALIHLLHILIFGTLLLYVAIKKNKIPVWLYSVLFYLGIFVFFYQGYEMYKKLQMGKNPWISLFHMVIIVPVLVLIGYNGVETPSYFYEFALMLAFTVFGYHGYYLFRNWK